MRRCDRHPPSPHSREGPKNVNSKRNKFWCNRWSSNTQPGTDRSFRVTGPVDCAPRSAGSTLATDDDEHAYRREGQRGPVSQHDAAPAGPSAVPTPATVTAEWLTQRLRQAGALAADEQVHGVVGQSLSEGV